MKPMNRRHTIIFAMLVIAFMACTGSCSVLFASFFGDELMYAESTVNVFDLAPEFKGAVGLTMSIRRLNSPVLDSIGLFIEGTEVPAKVILLDPKTLNVIDTITQAEATVFPGGLLFKQLSIQSASSYSFGNTFYDCPTKAVTAIDGILNPISSNNFYDSYILSGRHYVFYAQSNMGVQYYFQNPPYTYGSINIVPPVPSLTGTFLCSAMIDGNLIFIVKRSSDGILWKAVVDPLFPGNGVGYSLSFMNIEVDESDSQIWLTPGGLIARQYSSAFLTRFNLDSGLALDFIHLDTRNSYVYFENDGSYFYVVNRITGLMTKSKTWWKQ